MRTANEILRELGVPPPPPGKNRYYALCPQCSAKRSTEEHRRAKVLGVTIDRKGVKLGCNHCSFKGGGYFDHGAHGRERKPAEVFGGSERESPETDDRARVERARTIWTQAVDPTGTLVEQYLASRGLQLPDGMANRVVRFHGACPWRDDETEQLLHVPAMITAMVDIRTNKLRAIQKTAINADASKRGRKTVGVAKAACIKIDPDDAISSSLGLSEGFETGLAVALQGWRPIWAAGSAGAIEAFPVLPGVDCLTIFGDHERAGLAAAHTCAERWCSAGAEVAVHVPKLKDWNDAVLGRAAT
jgi:putative DNA primase/helicase